MMNVIRVRYLTFRAHSKISNFNAVMTQCSFCSSSQGDNDNKKEDDVAHEKKIDQKQFHTKKKKFTKLASSRTLHGRTALEKLLKETEVEGKQDDKKKDVGDKAQHSAGVRYSEQVHDQTKSREIIPGEEIQMAKLSQKVRKPMSGTDLLEKIRAAAVELGADVEKTKMDLLTAYKSMQDRPRKPRESQKFPESIKKTPEGMGKEVNKNEFGLKSILGNDKLGIFTEVKGEQQSYLKVWHQLYDRSMMDLSVPPPENFFQQLMLWTHQGKLWHFPIDNEQGMDVEEKTDFTEHIFLEKHLEPWCPRSGPLRHFMELVTVGLSKNPYISAQQKKDHILWYRDYFESKRKLLNEVGAFDPDPTPEIESK